MNSRPADLPDFVQPPVTEVVLGVQFGTLDRFKAPHLGLVWSEFKDRFPDIEEQPPLDPVFETFADKGPGGPMPRPQLQVLSVPPLPRIFLINRDRTELLQFQTDRFLHNWRKVGEEDTYPHFEKILPTFEDGYRRLAALVEREQLGALVPNQCEIAYINHIVRPEDQSPFDVFERLFGAFTKALILPDLNRPEDARFMFRYVMRGESGSPLGRLVVTAEPAWKPDGTNIIQLTLLARGKPPTADIAGVAEFLKRGRRHIVKAFTDLTSEEMHKVWERKQ